MRHPRPNAMYALDMIKIILNGPKAQMQVV